MTRRLAISGQLPREARAVISQRLFVEKGELPSVVLHSGSQIVSLRATSQGTELEGPPGAFAPDSIISGGCPSLAEPPIVDPGST